MRRCCCSQPFAWSSGRGVSFPFSNRPTIMCRTSQTSLRLPPANSPRPWLCPSLTKRDGSHPIYDPKTASTLRIPSRPGERARQYRDGFSARLALVRHRHPADAPPLSHLIRPLGHASRRPDRTLVFLVDRSELEPIHTAR